MARHAPHPPPCSPLIPCSCSSIVTCLPPADLLSATCHYHHPELCKVEEGEVFCNATRKLIDEGKATVRVRCLLPCCSSTIAACCRLAAVACLFAAPPAPAACCMLLRRRLLLCCCLLLLLRRWSAAACCLGMYEAAHQLQSHNMLPYCRMTVGWSSTAAAAAAATACAKRFVTSHVCCRWYATAARKAAS